jgi:hypothetical protein
MCFILSHECGKIFTVNIIENIIIHVSHKIFSTVLIG